MAFCDATNNRAHGWATTPVGAPNGGFTLNHLGIITVATEPERAELDAHGHRSLRSWSDG